MADNNSGFHQMKHAKQLGMLFDAMRSPVALPLADAILEEKRRQHEEVSALREMILRRKAAQKR